MARGASVTALRCQDQEDRSEWTPGETKHPGSFRLIRNQRSSSVQR